MTCCINSNFCLLKKLALHMLTMVKKGEGDSISGYVSQANLIISKLSMLPFVFKIGSYKSDAF